MMFSVDYGAGYFCLEARGIYLSIYMYTQPNLYYIPSGLMQDSVPTFQRSPH